MANKNPVAPELDLDSLRELDIMSVGLDTDGNYENFRLNGVVAGDASHSRWQQGLFERARMSGAVWSGVHWEDLRFEGCDLANAVADKLYSVRIEIRDSRLLGLRAGESTWRDAVFTECTASLAQFSNAKFERAVFERCDLTDADFTGADLRGVVFRDCDLRKADFSNTKLLDADWRGSQVEGLRVDVRSLRGLIVSAPQAAHFAKLLGLKVRSEDA